MTPGLELENKIVAPVYTDVELRTVIQAIALLNSMVISGEEHSVESQRAVREAIDIIKSKMKG